MANIALTKYCNLQCPYCFAQDMMTEEEKSNIEINILQDILKWLENTPEERIGLIGGEPTLHPKFKEILSIVNNYCERTQRTSILFTNGIKLKDFLPYISPNMSILININSPEYMTKVNFESLLETLNILYIKGKLQNQVTCGCNLCLEIQNYDFFWDIIDKYKINHVRVSVTAPSNLEYKNNKEKYYEDLKPIFLSFISNAKKRKVIVNLDCNHIPKCYFTPDELTFIIDNCNENPFIRECCEPCIDITADFKATCCFGTYDSLIDCCYFQNCHELKEYFLKEIISKKHAFNNFGKCQDCLDFHLKKCQGGCLGFSSFVKND